MFYGKAMIFSAPSGSGKTTLVKHLLKVNNDLGFSISASTRLKRNSMESDGIDYYFLTIDEFRDKIRNDEFIEWEEVYNGSFYGTLKSEVERLWNLGKHVIFDVDVKGGIALKKFFGPRALAIFVKVSDINVLSQRLKQRNTETPETFQKRIAKAEYELSFEPHFDVSIINDDLEKAMKESQRLKEIFINSELETFDINKIKNYS